MAYHGISPQEHSDLLSAVDRMQRQGSDNYFSVMYGQAASKYEKCMSLQELSHFPGEFFSYFEVVQTS